MNLIASFTGIDIQPMDMEGVFFQGPATELNQVVMVGKEKYLGSPGQGGQLRENGSSPVIIECDQ